MDFLLKDASLGYVANNANLGYVISNAGSEQIVINASSKFVVSSDFRAFQLSEILSATNNFSTKNKLGEGGFGPVYKVEKNNYSLLHFKKLGLLQFV